MSAIGGVRGVCNVADNGTDEAARGGALIRSNPSAIIRRISIACFSLSSIIRASKAARVARVTFSSCGSFISEKEVRGRKRVSDGKEERETEGNDRE